MTCTVEEPGVGNAPLHDELQASLGHAHLALTGLLALLEASTPGAALQAAQLQALLLPVADQLEQALHTAQLLGAES